MKKNSSKFIAYFIIYIVAVLFFLAYYKVDFHKPDSTSSLIETNGTTIQLTNSTLIRQLFTPNDPYVSDISFYVDSVDANSNARLLVAIFKYSKTYNSHSAFILRNTSDSVFYTSIPLSSLQEGSYHQVLINRTLPTEYKYEFRIFLEESANTDTVTLGLGGEISKSTECKRAIFYSDNHHSALETPLALSFGHYLNYTYESLFLLFAVTFSLMFWTIFTLDSKDRLTVTSLLVSISIIGLFFAYLSVIMLHGENIYMWFWNGSSAGIFPDFTESMSHAAGRDPYSLQAIYPAFTYLILWCLTRFIPWSHCSSFVLLSSSPIGITIVGFTFSISLFFLLLGIRKYLHIPSTAKTVFISFFFLSTPFLYGFERGNLVIFALLCLMGYVFLQQHPRFYMREISLLLLAACVSLKLYPVVFGLTLLIDKKYKEAARCMVYGILFFVLPFAFMGGFGKIPTMIANIFGLNTETTVDTRNFGYGFKVNFLNFYLAVTKHLGLPSSETMANIIIFLVVILLLISSFLLKESWKKHTVLALIIVVLPAFSWIYNVIYMLVPFILFLNERQHSKKLIDKIYALLFILMFLPIPFGYIMTDLKGANRMTLSCFMCSAALILMTALLLVESAKSLLQRRSSKKVSDNGGNNYESLEQSTI